MNIKIVFILLMLWIQYVLPISNTSVIQITLSSSQKGLLNGSYPAEVSLIDQYNNHTHWSNNQHIYFDNGFAEITLGPVDSFKNIKQPYVKLVIENSSLLFPIYPAFFSLHSKTTEQLSDTQALYVNDGNIGLGTQSHNKMTEKLTIDGNIKFLSPTNKLIFPNGQSISPETIQTLSQNIANNQSSINSLEIALNTIDTSHSNSIQISSAYQHGILISDPSGTISVFNDFYVDDNATYLLTSSQENLQTTKIGPDFKLINNDLSLSSINQLDLKPNELGTTPDTNGAIRFFNDQYYAYQNNGWKTILTDISSPIFTTNDSLTLNQYELKINDEDLTNNSLMIWKDNHLKSIALSSESGLTLSDTELSISNSIKNLASAITIGNDQMIGIGIHPTTPLDVSGSIRLRSQSISNIATPENGTIIFDGTNFKGYVNSEWASLSGVTNITNITSTNPSAFWKLTNNNLTTTPDNNVGIKTLTPQATLDISGNIRIRTILNNQSLTNYMVHDSNGDIYSKSLSLNELLSTAPSNGSFIFYDNSAWSTKQIQTDHMINFDNQIISLSTQNVDTGDMIYFSNGAWAIGPSSINLFDSILDIPTINASQSIQTPILNASQSIQTPILNASQSIQTPILNASQSLQVNKLSSTSGSPLKLLSTVDGSTDITTLHLNSDGKLSLGFGETHGNYRFASQGYNYFSHTISRYQTAIGTTNIGTIEYGPTLLIQANYYDPTLQVQSTLSPSGSPTRSIVEVLTIAGESVLEIQDGGNVGINTKSPKATLDINGLIKLKKHDAEPDININDTNSQTPCSTEYDGTIALTAKYTLCTCKGTTSAWVNTSDGTTTCQWQ